MKSTAQGRAIKKYRKSLGQRGLARFEVLGLRDDKVLIRSLAKRLSADDPDAVRLRAAIRKGIGTGARPTGGVWEALRQSPLVGAEIDLTRDVAHEREIDL